MNRDLSTSLGCATNCSSCTEIRLRPNERPRSATNSPKYRRFCILRLSQSCQYMFPSYRTLISFNSLDIVKKKSTCSRSKLGLLLVFSMRQLVLYLLSLRLKNLLEFFHSNTSSTINLKIDTSDERALVARQEQRRICHIHWICQPSQWHVRHKVCSIFRCIFDTNET